MWRIRAEQYDTFARASADAANRDLADYARQRFPDEFAGRTDADVRRWVGRVRETASRYGVDREPDVATFLDLSVMYGDDFPASAWAADVLAGNDLIGAQKMDLLRRSVRESGVDL